MSALSLCLWFAGTSLAGLAGLWTLDGWLDGRKDRR